MLQGCCDDACTFASQESDQKNDSLQWKQGSLTCPAGTKKISFKCINAGPETGGCGVANIVAEGATC